MLAENILNILDREQSLTDEKLAEVTAEYEAAKKEYEAAVDAYFAHEGGNREELSCAMARAEGKLNARKFSYDYQRGMKSAMEILSSHICNEIERHEAFSRGQTA